jgi:hypothetical protein
VKDGPPRTVGYGHARGHGASARPHSSGGARRSAIQAGGRVRDGGWPMNKVILKRMLRFCIAVAFEIRKPEKEPEEGNYLLQLYPRQPSLQSPVYPAGPL